MKNKLIIGSWSGIPEYNLLKKNDDEFLEKQFEMLAESGIELSPVPICHASEEFRLKTLELAQKNGLKQLIEDYEMSVFLKTLKNRPSVTEEKAVGLILEYSRKYLEYESFAGYFIADEPSIEEAANLVYASRIFKKALPGKLFYFNLFPQYALPSCLKTDSYDDYIAAFSKAETDYMSFDFYALMTENGENYVRNGFLENIAKVKKTCDELGKDMWAFCCSSAHYYGAIRGSETYGQAAFQAFVNYTLGARGIFWFCYYAPDVDDSYLNALVDREGRKDVAYENVKKVNAELKALDEYLWDYECVCRGAVINGQLKTISGGVPTDKPGKSPTDKPGKSPADDFTVKILAAERNVVFAAYGSGGDEGILITNFDEPTSGRENAVTVKVDSPEANVLSAGKTEKIRCDGGKLKYKLKSGGAIFVSPCGR
ncbi:MAG: hypothetical protein MR437_02195 [Clostridiales bacterium]|nr:hypothetical protein [Clostridiales bacterium]